MTWRVRARVSLAAFGLAVALAGCGADEGAPPKPAEGARAEAPWQLGGRSAPSPRPQNRLRGVAEGLRRAVADGDCDGVRKRHYSGLRSLDRKACARLLVALAGFEPVRSRRYGTAALVEYEGTARKGPLAGRIARGAVLFVLNRDLRFTWVANLGAGYFGAIGEPPSDRDDLQGSARSVLAALRRADCAALRKRLPRAVTQNRKLSEKDCFARFRTPFQADLAGDPEARPELMGANGQAGFFRVRTRGHYHNLAMVRQGRRYTYFGSWLVR